MKRLALTSLLCLVGCSAPETPTTIDQSTFTTCDDRTFTVTVTAERTPIGPSSNAIRKFGDAAFIVESGSNTVAKIAGGEVSEFANVENDRNPWDVWADDDTVWVTNYLRNSVSVLDRTTGELLHEIEDDAFDNPSAIVGIGDHVYISQVAFRGTEYGSGSVVQIDRTSREVVRTFPTVDRNPQFLSVVEHQGIQMLAVTNSGEFEVTDAGAFAKTDGSLELWTLDGDAVTQEVYPLPLVDDRRIGSPGEPHQVGDTLYLSSGTAPVMFKFDLASRTFERGTRDPIVLYETEDDALHRTSVHRDLIWVTAFNQDALLVFDPECDRVVDADIALDRSELLAGPYGTVFFRDKVDSGFFILSNANTVGRLELKEDDDD